MSNVRWGVLSTANIATEKVIPAMQRGQHSVVTAIASRDLTRAEETARRLGVARAYGSYQELLRDPEVDAVYNPLPNHLHVPWSLKALEADKHVLCEKPIALSAAQAEELLEAARRHPRLKTMEAFMYRFHPQWQRAKALVDEGAIGELKTVQTFFSYRNTDPANIRNRADIGGGGLMDIGCYAVSLSRLLFAEEPARVLGVMAQDPAFATDVLTSGILEFSTGTATFTCGTQLAPYQRVNILGSEGRVEIEIPFNAPPDKPCRIWHQRGGDTREILFETVDQYTLQGDAFSRAVIEDLPVPTPLSDAVANMRALEAIVSSAQDGSWASPTQR